jgi:hypothetical protein
MMRARLAPHALWPLLLAALLAACAGPVTAPRDMRDQLAYGYALHESLTSTVDRLSQSGSISDEEALRALDVLDRALGDLAQAQMLITGNAPDLSTAQGRLDAARMALIALQTELNRHVPRRR